MLDPHTLRARYKALLTETLPHEVPLIFSNDRFYASLVARRTDPQLSRQLSRLRRCAGNAKPYSYEIVKGTNNLNQLSIIHPTIQMEISNFYDQFQQSILAQCSRDAGSLRYPTSIVPLISKAELEGATTFRRGIPHVDPSDGEMDVSHAPSYFTYAKYKLLYRFFESEEFRALERQFKYLVFLDVAKCFFNIYTHSITWAVKDKSFAKRYKRNLSFEGAFDKLMQRANYNETNGIVVGPEVSRIFAEIIFQQIDNDIIDKIQHTHGEHYAVRRYVDDFFAFSNDRRVLEDVERAIRSSLESYKLYVNEQKRVESERPFVSDITLARSRLKVVLGEIFELSQDLSDISATDLRRQARQLGGKLDDLRLIVADAGVHFHMVSGWLFSAFRRVFGRVCSRNMDFQNAETATAVLLFISSALKVVFYVALLEVRVTTTYSVCQILQILSSLENRLSEDDNDALGTQILVGLDELLRNSVRGKPVCEDRRDPVEIFNLLICGAHFFGRRFLRLVEVERAVRSIVCVDDLSYFGYVAAKFSMLKDKENFSKELDELNQRVMRLLDSRKDSLQSDAENYLFFCDLMSSPDLDVTTKWKFYHRVIGGNPSKSTIDRLSNVCGFVDWDGVRIAHFLARIELRPVYE